MKFNTASIFAQPFKRIHFILSVLLCGFVSGQNKSENGPSDKPNIIIILADDMGYGDPEVYNDESKIPTPNINALAANGMRFTDAHSPSSVCTPTRYGILTGRYAWRTPLKKSVLWAWDKPLIETDRKTMPKMLSAKGYNTACIGKWHLGWRWPGKNGGFMNDTIPIGNFDLKGRNELWKKIDFTKKLGGGPLEAGFDYYFGDDVPNFAPYTFFENNALLAIPDTLKPKTMFGGPGPMAKGWDLTKVMPTITAKSVQYIEDQSIKDKPFFLYFALTAPHTPIAPASEFMAKSGAGRYGDYVSEVDWTVGQIVEALKRTGQLENTILVFTSDNGSPQRDGENMGGAITSVRKYGHDPSRPWRGIKADIWDGGHRVPFIVSWPNRIKKGTVSDRLLCLTDLMATFGSFLGIPSKDFPLEDSYDISNALLGKPTTNIRQDIVHHSIDGTFSLRKGDWKLILGKDSGGFSKNLKIEGIPVATEGQLYNLANDPSEKNNRYAEKPEIVAELTALLDRYREQGYSNPKFQQ